MLMMPEPMCICFVRAATNGMIVSLAEMWEYSQRKWCSVHHEYFQFERSPTSASTTSLMRRACSASGSDAIWSLWTNPPMNSPNSIDPDLRVRSARPVDAPPKMKPVPFLHEVDRMSSTAGDGSRACPECPVKAGLA